MLSLPLRFHQPRGSRYIATGGGVCGARRVEERGLNIGIHIPAGGPELAPSLAAQAAAGPTGVNNRAQLLTSNAQD